MYYTPRQVILIAKVSQYLAENDIDKKGLYGGGMDLLLPNKIYCVRKNVSWLYDQDDANSTLQATANYLLALCGRYGLAAQVILSQYLISEASAYILTQNSKKIKT
jgi:hypothetical protein